MSVDRNDGRDGRFGYYSVLKNMNNVQENIAKLKSEIEEVCLKIQRSPQSIKIVAVSKTFPSDYIKEAVNAGIVDIGENYVQELLKKKDELKDLNNIIKWHFVGNLQTNKVKKIIREVEMLHSIDRGNLVDEIEKRNAGNPPLNVLIEVNLGNEEGKSGCLEEGVYSLAEKILNCSNLKLKGVMSVPPYFLDSEKSRPYFRKLREIKEGVIEKFRDKYYEKLKDFNEISMGMSNDFKVAIEEGATIIRIGTKIFGERKY